MNSLKRVARPTLVCLETRDVPTFYGNSLFPADNPWNQDISSAPIAANSASIINKIVSRTGTRGIHPDFGNPVTDGALYGIPVNIADSTTPKYSIYIPPEGYASESDIVQVPIPDNAVIEGDGATGPNPSSSRGDSHLLVYDKTANKLYELFCVTRPSETSFSYGGTKPTGVWGAYQISVWDMNKNSFRTPDFTSADAAGLPILPGLVRPDEALPTSSGGQGTINHAIRVTVQQTQKSYIYPASHYASSLTGSDLPRMGERFRLRSDFVIPSTWTPEAQAVAQAMKTYGLIVADNGSDFFFQGTPSDQWNMDGMLALRAIKPADFQVVNLTPVVTGLSVTSGPSSGGTSITVTGQNFSGAGGQLQVMFGNTPAPAYTIVSDSKITVTTPAVAAGTVNVTVVSGTMKPNGDGVTVFFGYGTSAVTPADNYTFTQALYINSVTPTSTGVSVQFNEPIDPTVLNLYDQGGQFGPADLTLSGPSGQVRGSLVLTASTGLSAGQYDGFTFVATGGATASAVARSVLPTGSYTLTLNSGSNAFKDLSGKLLNGGGNFVQTFNVTAPPTEIVSLPSFVRGTGQAVRLPTDTAAGLPVYLSDGSAVGSVSLAFTYDNTLLKITGFTPNAAIPGVNSTFGTSTSGTTTTITITVFGTAAFGSSGSFTLGNFTATVPATAPYGAKAVLHFTNLITQAPGGANVTSIGADGLQLAAYVADVNHNRTYDTADLLLENRLFVGSVTGLVGSAASPSFPLVDPGLIGSIGGTGTIGAADILQVSRELVGTSVLNIPTIPNLGSQPPNGVDPRVYIPRTLVAQPGGTVSVPIQLAVTDSRGIRAGIGAVSLVISYDPSALTFQGISLGSLLSDPASGFSAYVTSKVPGLLRVVTTSSKGTGVLPFGTKGSIAVLAFTVNSTAAGSYVMNLQAGAGNMRTAVIDNSFQTLVLSPTPTDAAGDEVDGIVTVTRPKRFVPMIAGNPYNVIKVPPAVSPSTQVPLPPNDISGTGLTTALHVIENSQALTTRFASVMGNNFIAQELGLLPAGHRLASSVLYLKQSQNEVNLGNFDEFDDFAPIDLLTGRIHQ